MHCLNKKGFFYFWAKYRLRLTQNNIKTVRNTNKAHLRIFLLERPSLQFFMAIHLQLSCVRARAHPLSRPLAHLCAHTRAHELVTFPFEVVNTPHYFLIVISHLWKGTACVCVRKTVAIHSTQYSWSLGLDSWLRQSSITTQLAILL